ncbi:MAG: hypothetical protein KAT78_08845, partial [Flavobacteriaceae bacterium]|nr:hypothetical protein [Flavobacteriaceae bacterium]
YLFMFIFATASLTSCGASSQSCATTKIIQVKNSKFETYEIVVSTDMITSTEAVTPADYIVTNDDMD